jgi:excinuclease UvrABC nuclease subunit
VAPRTSLKKSPALKPKLSDLPTQPNGYLCRDAEANLLCVGKTKVLRNRVRSCFSAAPKPRLSTPRTMP